ncbi:conserved hypothetical protein [Chryseobacterium sp. 8AT]|nr:conserved hypothetical protein [Chryseobacterium sp. 8AT]
MPLFILKKTFIVKTLFALAVKNARIYKEFNKNTEIKVNKAVSLIFERQRFKMHNGFHMILAKSKHFTKHFTNDDCNFKNNLK